MKDEKIVVGRHVDQIRQIMNDVVEKNLPTLCLQATADKIAELREKHVRRYETRLAFAARVGGPGVTTPVNVAETRRLLELWQGMEGKAFSELGEDQKLEVLDALVDE
jgi:hypothetical protein